MTVPTFTAEIMFSSNVWTDVTQWLVQSADIQRGSSRVESPVIRYEAGHIAIRLRNDDRRFDPTNLYGPYVVSGVSKVTPMRPIRLMAIWKGISYPLFRGFVDNFTIAWTADVYSEVIVTATDGFKVIANKKRAPTLQVINGEIITVTYGEGENTGARITRILDSADWPSTDRVIATGDSTLQATPLSGDALSEMQTAVETEVGELYIDASGRVVFRNRHAIHNDTRSNTVQAEFGTFVHVDGTTSPGDVVLNTDHGTLWNEAVVTRVDGQAQVTEDSASVTEYLYSTFDKSGLMMQDNITALSYGMWIVYTSKDPELRYETLRLIPAADPGYLFPQVLTREIGDRIRIVKQPPGGGLPVAREVFIRGIQHIKTQENWITSWILQSATRYTANFFILDSATNGVLNQNVLTF